MKRLYLVRHAKSSWKDKSLHDHDRPLNRRGKRDLPQMGLRLKRHGVQPCLICSSTAKRALKTAKGIAKALGYPRKRIVRSGVFYEKGLEEMLDFLTRLDDATSEVMIFGHHTELIALAEHLLPNPIGPLPTCGVWGLEFPVDSWQELGRHGGRLFFDEYPKKPQSARTPWADSFS